MTFSLISFLRVFDFSDSKKSSRFGQYDFSDSMESSRSSLCNFNDSMKSSRAGLSISFLRVLRVYNSFESWKISLQSFSC